VPLEGRLPFERAVRIADELVAIAERDLTLARRAGDLRLDGEPLAILHFEGAEPIDPQLANLEAWYERGLRSLGLVWSRPNAFVICPIPRSLTDAQLDGVRDSGGLVGVVFDTVMTGPDGDLVLDTPLSTIASHFEYLAGRMGVEHVALGSDFDGCFPPGGLSDASKTQSLFEELDWSDDELAALGHGNWLRVLGEVWR
jgi:microsomal dipeptidase-like Zn-dependent dipeptidase